MTPPAVLRTDRDGPIVTITLDRPDALNALDRALKEDLFRVLETAGRDDGVRVVILTGAGRAFCAGQDLGERTEGFGDELRQRFNPIILAIRDAPKPIIAAVNGVAAGAGASIAFACDIRIAAVSASFNLAFGRVGLVPDSGATWFLPRLVGPALAAELILTSGSLSAADALTAGLVSRVVPGDALLDEARGLAERLAAGAPRAMALAKQALARSQEVGLAEALEIEAELQEIAGATADHAEGVAAFREKRTPRFTGS